MVTEIDQLPGLYDSNLKSFLSVPDQDDAEHSEVRRLSDEGLNYYLQGDSQQAAEFFRRALELRPDNAAALYSLGMIYGQLGRHEESRECFWRLVQRLDAQNKTVDPALRSAAHRGLG